MALNQPINSSESPAQQLDQTNLEKSSSALNKISVEESIKVLHILNESARSAEYDPTWYENLVASKNLPTFQKLSGEEAQQYLYGRTTNLSWLQNPPDIFYLQNTDQPSKLSFKIRTLPPDTLDAQILENFQQSTGRDPFEFIFQALSPAAQKYRQLLSTYHFEDRTNFPLNICKGQNMAVSMLGGDTVEIGAQVISNLLSSVINKDYAAYQSARSSLQSQYFHEFIHQLNNEDRFDNDTIEELTILGEFLYDPLHNTDRNEKVFRKNGEYIFDEAALRAAGKWLEAYDIPYQKIISKILLYELALAGKIQLPLTEETQKLILTNIDEFYAPMSEAERDTILKKYLPLKKNELYQLGEQLAQKLSEI